PTCLSSAASCCWAYLRCWRSARICGRNERRPGASRTQNRAHTHLAGCSAPQRMKRQVELILDAPGERLDKALAQAMPEISRSQWQQLIRDGLVMVGGAPVRASLRLDGGERVVASLPEVAETELVADDIPLDILYEDADLLAVNKPAGMVVHPAPGHSTGTLVNAVFGYGPELEGVGGERRPGIVHRLDRDTPGVIVVAKNDRALRHLQKQFKRRSVQKVYLALVDG